MSILYLTGDLFLSRAQTLAHGANCQGRMGAGIALELRRRFPAMYEEYRRRCRSGEFQPGDIFLWQNSSPWVLNLATQATTGGATNAFLEEAIEQLATRYAELGITSIAMPRIAAGLGRLEWRTVRSLIEGALGNLPIPVYLYEHYVEGVAGVEEPGTL